MTRSGTEKSPFADFEKKLGYVFGDPNLLEEALTHASYANESGLSRSNERLEFLGDAVLELCVSELLYRKHDAHNEGRLTKERSEIVRTTALAAWARQISLPPLLKLGRGLDVQRGRENPSILADAMEAVLGAAFLDGGYEATAAVIGRVIENGVCGGKCRQEEKKDAKSRLQELMQSSGGKPPIYRLKRRTGPDHAATFEVEVVAGDGSVLSAATGNSIKTAEFVAAERAIERLGQLDQLAQLPPDPGRCIV